MPKKPVDEKRVVLNTLIAPGTREEIARQVAATKKSQGVVIDEAIAGGSVETGERSSGVLDGLTSEALVLIRAESARLTDETGKPVSGAEVVEMAVVKWCSVDEVPDVSESAVADFPGRNDGEESGNETRGPDDKWATAKAAMRAAEAGTASVPVVPKVNKGAESVAQRKAREAREHAAALAESDVAARLTGRDDIEYDLENVPHRSVADPAPVRGDGKPMEPIIQRPGHDYKRNWKPLTRPHGGTEAKRKREQQ